MGWQFRNQLLYSLTDPIDTASHHYLNYKISEEFTLGKYGLLISSYYLFSPPYMVAYLQSKSILTKKKSWIEQVILAQADYKESDDPLTRQLLAQQDYMNNYLITDSNFVQFLEHDKFITVQDSPITQDYLYTAMINYLANFGPSPVSPAIAATPAVTSGKSLHHSSLSDFWYPL